MIKYKEVLKYFFWMKLKDKKIFKFNKNITCSQLNMSLYYLAALIPKKSINFLSLMKMFRNQFYSSALFCEVCSEILRFGTQTLKRNLFIILILWFNDILDPNVIFTDIITDSLLTIIAKLGSLEKSLFLSFYFLIKLLKKQDFYQRINIFTKYFLRRLLAIFYSKRHEYQFCILVQKSFSLIHKKTRNVISTLIKNGKRYGTLYFCCRNIKCYTNVSKIKKNVGFCHWIRRCLICNLKLHDSFTWNISDEFNFIKIIKYYNHQLMKKRVFSNVNIRNIIVSYIVSTVVKGDVLLFKGLFYRKNDYCEIINVHKASCRVKIASKNRSHPTINISWHDLQMKSLNY